MSNHFLKTNLLIFIFVATRLLLHLSDHFHGHERDFAAIGGYSLLSPEVAISQSQKSLYIYGRRPPPQLLYSWQPQGVYTSQVSVTACTDGHTRLELSKYFILQ